MGAATAAGDPPRRPAGVAAPARACIFDMDGLLVDSEPFWRAAHAELMADLGVDVSPFLGTGLTTGMRVDEVVALWRAHSPWQGPSDEEVAARIVSHVAAAVRERAVLLPGALEALDFCGRHGLAAALATGSTVEIVQAVLERFDLARRFDAVCSAEHDTHSKPHPAIFLRAAELLGAPPSACVVFEDSLNGVVAAKAARMRVIAVPPLELAEDPRYALADLCLDSLLKIDTPAVLAMLGLPADA